MNFKKIISACLISSLILMNLSVYAEEGESPPLLKNPFADIKISSMDFKYMDELEFNKEDLMSQMVSAEMPKIETLESLKIGEQTSTFNNLENPVVNESANILKNPFADIKISSMDFKDMDFKDTNELALNKEDLMSQMTSAEMPKIGTLENLKIGEQTSTLNRLENPVVNESANVLKNPFADIKINSMDFKYIDELEFNKEDVMSKMNNADILKNENELFDTKAIEEDVIFNNLEVNQETLMANSPSLSSLNMGSSDSLEEQQKMSKMPFEEVAEDDLSVVEQENSSYVEGETDEVVTISTETVETLPEEDMFEGIVFVELPTENDMIENNTTVLYDGYSVLKNDNIADEDIIEVLKERELPYKDEKFIDSFVKIYEVDKNKENMTYDYAQFLLITFSELAYYLQIEVDKLNEFSYGHIIYKYIKTKDKVFYDEHKLLEAKKEEEEERAKQQEAPQINENNLLSNNSLFDVQSWPSINEIQQSNFPSMNQNLLNSASSLSGLTQMNNATNYSQQFSQMNSQLQSFNNPISFGGFGF